MEQFHLQDLSEEVSIFQPQDVEEKDEYFRKRELK